jgi:hypothetical protein
VAVTVTGLDTLGSAVSVLSVERVDQDRREYVRGAVAVLDPTDPSALFIDTAAGFGRSLTYVATVILADGSILTATSTPLTLSVDVPWLSEPISGRALPVTVLSWPELEHDTPASVIRVAGRAAPVVVLDIASSAESEVTLRTSSLTDLRELRDLAGRGEALLLRATCQGVEDGYLAVLGRTERRVTNSGEDERRNVALTVQHVDLPAPDVAALGDTLADLAEAYPSPPANLTTLGGAYPTLLDLARDNLGAI